MTRCLHTSQRTNRSRNGPEQVQITTEAVRLVNNAVNNAVNMAVDMAVDNRTQGGPTILHADYGSQFASWSFGENLRRWGLLGSFGTVGICFDYTAMESFWARMHVELLNIGKWPTTIKLAAAMADTSVTTQVGLALSMRTRIRHIRANHHAVVRFWPRRSPLQ